MDYTFGASWPCLPGCNPPTWCCHMEVRMKNSSMNTAPKGRMPPMRMEKMEFMYQGCSGIWRGILLVRTGSCSMHNGQVGAVAINAMPWLSGGQIAVPLQLMLQHPKASLSQLLQLLPEQQCHPTSGAGFL